MSKLISCSNLFVDFEKNEIVCIDEDAPTRDCKNNLICGMCPCKKEVISFHSGD